MRKVESVSGNPAWLLYGWQFRKKVGDSALATGSFERIGCSRRSSLGRYQARLAFCGSLPNGLCYLDPGHEDGQASPSEVEDGQLIDEIDDRLLNELDLDAVIANAQALKSSPLPEVAHINSDFPPLLAEEVVPKRKILEPRKSGRRRVSRDMRINEDLIQRNKRRRD
ncbi:hypothetical protein Dimus_020565 [Dionaea muscipula]